LSVVGDAAAPEEPEPLVAPLDGLLELEAEVTGVEARGAEATGVETTGVEAIGVLPVPVLGLVPVLSGGVTATTLLASVAVPALCVEPPHPGSRSTEMAKAPSIWAKSPRRRSIFMCIASLMGKCPKSALAIADR
jgi:hypothetical protein